MQTRWAQLLQWLIAIVIIGSTVGVACTLFSIHLTQVGQFRDAHVWVYFLLPIGGLLVQSSYYFSKRGLAKGNNLIIESYYIPEKAIHWLMAPLVYIGTLVTHIVGGSAGREGTAVQIGATLAAQLRLPLFASKTYRQTLIQMGVAAGFSALFGTPLAAIFFSLEMFRRKQLQVGGLIPIGLSSILAYYTTHLFALEHSTYLVTRFPELSLSTIAWVMLCAALFGGVAYSFVFVQSWFSRRFKAWSIHPVLLTVAGAMVLLLFFRFTGMYHYSGLGIGYIQQSFVNPSHSYDFVLKLLLTTFTLSIGFKGGEVTPLFFIGATLGSFLSLFVPLSTDFLASLGFIAVFGSATKTPLASTVIGMELFGLEGGLLYFIVCFISHALSGKEGIYLNPTPYTRS